MPIAFMGNEFGSIARIQIGINNSETCKFIKKKYVLMAFTLKKG